MRFSRSLGILLSAFVMVCCAEKEVRNVAIQPLGSFEKAHLDSIAGAVRSMYGFKVTVHRAQPMPERFFVNIKSPRYRADSIITHLQNTKPESDDLVLGVTKFDISITDRDWLGRVKEPSAKYTDWGVFGYGFQPGVSSVVSTFRIKHSQPGVTISRLKKICLHEIGHNLGLKHCESARCFMRDAAESISTIDQVDIKLCATCKRKVE
jgi:archaemetzincin